MDDFLQRPLQSIAYKGMSELYASPDNRRFTGPCGQDMMQAFRPRLLESATVLVLAGCVAIPPQPIPVSRVPAISGPSCNVTLVRKKELAGSAPSHFISLDKLTVAVLEVGEYTTFQVSEGRHSLSVTWQAGDKLLGVGGFGAGAAALAWSPHAKSVAVDCRAPANYFFAIASRGFPPDENDRVELQQVGQFDGDFVLERNRFVSPGPR